MLMLRDPLRTPTLRRLTVYPLATRLGMLSMVHAVLLQAMRNA